MDRIVYLVKVRRFGDRFSPINAFVDNQKVGIYQMELINSGVNREDIIVEPIVLQDTSIRVYVVIRTSKYYNIINKKILGCYTSFDKAYAKLHSYTPDTTTDEVLDIIIEEHTLI